MGLNEYWKKRTFIKTPEPHGLPKEGRGNLFVVHEHWTSRSKPSSPQATSLNRVHWDLRIEKAGVLKSWAVPKGMPTEPGAKRLAVPTEDHPLEYADFEGKIPEGQYGAGVVKIWDKGNYEEKVWEPEKIEVVFNGKKLTGQYVMVKTKIGWLVWKKG